MRNPPAVPYILMGESQEEKQHAARCNAMLAQARIAPASELYGNPHAGHKPIALATEALQLVGRHARGLTNWEVVAQAFTTSDFPSLLEDVAHKSALKGFDAAPETYAA